MAGFTMVGGVKLSDGDQLLQLGSNRSRVMDI